MTTATADADTLLSRAALMVDAGRLAAARPLLAAVRRMAPPSARLAELAVRLALQEGRPEDARAEIDQAVADAPDHAGLRKCRADVRMRLGDVAGATADAAEAVVLDRHDPAAKALLGLLLIELGRPDDARACLAEAVAIDPANPSFLQGLARAQDCAGDPDGAATTLAAGIARMPARTELRASAILLAIRARDFDAALAHAEAARMAGAADACVFGLMGHALSSLGRHDDAAEAYGEALKLGPDDPYVRHLVASAGRVAGAAQAPADYVRTIFDGYAERFELHLIGLGYRIPGVVRAALLARGGGRTGPVLDLGCGTGLIGVALSDLDVAPLVGVDLSGRMLAEAAAKGLYAELHEAEIVAMLAADERAWPVIVAADVLCYFGALDEVMAAVFARLAPGGAFLFSVEQTLPPRGGSLPADARWALEKLGRYTHAPAYVQRAAAAAGFSIRALVPEVIRLEAQLPVAGLFGVLERPA